MTPIRRRAVSAEQKEKRRQDILDSAKTLFESSRDYNALLMKNIAENIGLTKGTLYLYFKTKEEVFLALYSQEFNQCFSNLDAALDELAGEGCIEVTATTMTEILSGHQTFLRLTSLLHGVLEQNIEAETALVFKTLLRDRIFQTGQKLERALPVLKPGEGIEILMAAHALMIGYFHATLPTPALDEILARPDMCFMKLDFVKEFKKTLKLIMFARCHVSPMATK